MLITYIVYTKDLKNEIANNATLSKLKQAENKGLEEYNRLQNFRQKIKKEKPPEMIDGGKRKINLNIDMNAEPNMIDNINDLKNSNINDINYNLIDSNIIQ